jgi:hypothetical protein
VVRARAESVQPNLAKIGDQRGSSAEVLGRLRPKVCRTKHTFGFIPWHSAERLNGQPRVAAPTRAGWLAVEGRPDDRFIYLSDVPPTAW